jgi:hypothetical protein
MKIGDEDYGGRAHQEQAVPDFAQKLTAWTYQQAENNDPEVMLKGTALFLGICAAAYGVNVNRVLEAVALSHQHGVEELKNDTSK